MPSKQIVSYVMHMLSQGGDIEGVPPGGGLVSKSVISWLYSLICTCKLVLLRRRGCVQHRSYFA